MFNAYKAFFSGEKQPTVNVVLVVISMVIGGLALAVGFAFLFGFLVMWLWNWLMPSIFGLPRINYWQAWGLFLLCQILFRATSSSGGKDHKSSKHKGSGFKFSVKNSDSCCNCEGETPKADGAKPEAQS